MSALELAGGLSPAAAAAALGAAALAGAAGGAALAARGRDWLVRLLVGGLYALGALAPVAAWLAPTDIVTNDAPVRPRVAVLVDRSASMREADLPGGRERWRLAAELLAEGSPLRLELERSARASLLAFDARERPLEAGDLAGPPDGPATDIAAALGAALAAPGVGPLAAAVLVSDGRATAGLPLALAQAELSRRKVPIWTVGAGDPAAKARPRLTIAGFDPPETAALGQDVTVEAVVEARNLAGRSCRARLLLDGREVGAEDLGAPAGAARLPVRFTFPARPEGVRRLELVAAAAPDLAARALRRLVVLGRPLRVFYAEGRLGWGYRELGPALAAGPGRELELWPGFLDAAARPESPDAALAARIGKLDVVVLGDVAAGELGPQGAAALARAVREDGCGLLFAAGPERAASYRGTPLEALLPVTLDYGPAAAPAARRVEPAADLQRAEVMRLDPAPAEDFRLWATLPETRGEWKLGKPRTGAETWLRAGGEPVLAAWKAGAGRAAALGWPDHWRWARASPDGAEAYRRFFARLAGWLANREGAGDEKLALSLTRYRLRPGEEVSLLARLLKVPDAPLVELAARVGALGPAGEEARIGLSPAAPGVYRATLRGGAAGEYRAEVTARAGGAEWARAEVSFSVEGREVEAEDPTPDFAALSALAKATGGTLLGPADAERLPLLLRKSLPRPEPRLRRARTTRWDRVWYLGLALAAFCGAWAILRRSK